MNRVFILDCVWYGVLLNALLFFVQGMGEPLNNYTNLVQAIRAMSGSPFHISLKKITVSTVRFI